MINVSYLFLIVAPQPLTIFVDPKFAICQLLGQDPGGPKTNFQPIMLVEITLFAKSVLLYKISRLNQQK